MAPDATWGRVMVRRFRNVAVGIYVPIALLGLWWFATKSGESVYWPPIQQIVETFANTWVFERLTSDLIPSATRYALGLSLAIVLGVGFGLLMGTIPLVQMAFGPIADFFRSIPAPAMLPAMIVIFGISTTQKVLFIGIATMWPILLNTVDGIRGVDQTLLNVSRAYRLTPRERALRVVLPAASPQIFAGIRLAVAMGMVAMVVSEMVASSNGLGFFALQSQQTFAIPEMWTGIIVIGLLGIAANAIFSLVERRVLSWHRGWKAVAFGSDSAN